MPRPLSTPVKDPVPIVQEAGWAPGPVWTGAENLAPTGIRSPHRTARSQSLYRLNYPAHQQNINLCICLGVLYRIAWRWSLRGQEHAAKETKYKFGVVLRLNLDCLFVDSIIVLTVEGSFMFGNLTSHLADRKGLPVQKHRCSTSNSQRHDFQFNPPNFRPSLTIFWT
jgi:hypothetical protein